MTSDKAALKGCDVVYTDVWASMGQKETLEEKKKVFMPYQVCWRWLLPLFFGGRGMLLLLPPRCRALLASKYAAKKHTRDAQKKNR